MSDMPENPTTEAPPETFNTTFPPMYYNSPVTQAVLSGFHIAFNGRLTAAITAGAPYFKIAALDVTRPPIPPPPGTHPAI